jgi:hypothetical protein
METAQAMGWGLAWATVRAPEQEQVWARVSERVLWGSASVRAMEWEPVTGWGLRAWC